MIGTLINCAAIVLGTCLGLLLQRGMKPAVSHTVMQGVGLSVILIGLMGAIETGNTLLVILSMGLGQWAQRKLTRGEGEGNTFAKGFVTASLVYCVGAMAVVGALDSGIRGDHSTLIAKAALDGVTAVIFASSLGIGVMLSAVPVFVYQGAIALLGNAVAPLLSDAVITEMSAVGGLLIMGIGVNMLLEKDIKVANLLPAIVVPFLYFPLYNLIVR